MRIGIAAPKSVAVHREKIFERIKTEQETHQRKGQLDPPGMSLTDLMLEADLVSAGACALTIPLLVPALVPAMDIRGEPRGIIGR